MFCAIAEENVIARRMKGAPEESTKDVQPEADSDGEAVKPKKVATKIRTLKKNLRNHPVLSYYVIMVSS